MKKKNPAAQALGKLGGKARAKALSFRRAVRDCQEGSEGHRSKKLEAAERSEIARKAVEARIAKHGQQRRKGENK